MANSKAYLPFVLLFAFLLTSHVLAHHDSPQNQHSYDDEENVIEHVNPTSSQDLEMNYWRGVDELGESDWTIPQVPRKNILGIGSNHQTLSTTYDPSNLEVDETKNYVDSKVTRHHNMERHSNVDFWRAFLEFTRTYGKNYSGVPTMEDTEPKSYTDAGVTRHDNMERHERPEFCRAFREFHARNYGKIH